MIRELSHTVFFGKKGTGVTDPAPSSRGTNPGRGVSLPRASVSSSSLGGLRTGAGVLGGRWVVGGWGGGVGELSSDSRACFCLVRCGA